MITTIDYYYHWLSTPSKTVAIKVHFFSIEHLDLIEFPNLKKWFQTITIEHSHLYEIASKIDGVQGLEAMLQQNFQVNNYINKPFYTFI